MKQLTSDELSQFKAAFSLKLSEKINIDYKLFGELDSCLRGDLQRTFYVDEFPEFSAALATSVSECCRQKTKSDVQYLDNVITCYADSAEAIKHLLLNVTEIDWNIPLVFTGLQRFLHVLEEIAVLKGGKLEKELCPCYHTQLDWLPTYTLPEGYKLSELTASDAPSVTETWQHSSDSENTEEYIQWLISTFKSIAVYNTANALVAYMIQCHNGSIGMLRVDPDHRGKGLAKVVVTELARIVMKSGQPAYVFIDNDISLKLHEKCGFQKTCDAFWAFYTPSSCKTSCVKSCV